MENMGSSEWTNRNVGVQDIQNEIDAAEAAEAEAEERELQSYLESEPLDEQEAETFLEDIDEMVPEEEVIPEIEYNIVDETNSRKVKKHSFHN